MRNHSYFKTSFYLKGNAEEFRKNVFAVWCQKVKFRSYSCSFVAFLFQVGFHIEPKYCNSKYFCQSQALTIFIFNESTLKMMKNVFYFILKAVLVLKIVKYLS